MDYSFYWFYYKCT